jgi:hypothetical protein
MAKLTAAKLMKELLGLNHAERAKRVGQLGNALAADELRAMCSALYDSADFGDFGAQTAVALARHGSFADVVLQALRHPSLLVQSHAIRSLHAITLTDAQLGAAYLGAAQIHRPVCIALMRSGQRHDLARQLVSLPTQTDRAKSQLLTACSESYAREVLPSVAHAVGIWGSLAKAHPDVVVEFARSSIAAAPLSQQLSNLVRFSSAFGMLSISRPRELLSLFAAVADDPGHLLSSQLTHLIRVAPAETASYILGLREPRHVINNRRIGRCLRLLEDRPAGATPGPFMRSLARKVGDNHSTLAELMRACPPSHRGALLQEAFAERSLDSLVLNDALMEVLPHSVRSEQAMRMLVLREVAADADSTLRISTYLPFAEAWPILEPMTKRSDADQRANGYQRMIMSATLSRDRGAFTQMMQHLTRLKNDQDPVRMQAMAMLRQVPANRFGDEDAPFLSALAECIVEARDTSWSTRSNLQSVLVEVLIASAPQPAGPLFQSALTSLVRLAGRDGTLPLPYLQDRLPQRHVAAFIDALLPLAKTRALTDHESLTLSIARSLGRKAWNHAELQNLLETILLRGKVSGVRSGVDFYLANPRFRVKRAESLVAKDESYLYLQAVYQVANREAQHLLAPLLTGVPLKGRFASKQNVATVPLFSGAFHRWTPPQVEAYGTLLVRLANTKGATSWEQVGAIRTLAQLPEIASALITQQVASPSEDVPRLEAAIAALANTDRPQLSIPTLLSFAGNDRARVAIYALGRAVRRSPGVDAAPLLIELANDASAKITSRKEAIRLLGEVRTPQVDSALETLITTTDLHKDLRIALGWAALANSTAPWFSSAIASLATGSVDTQQSLVAFHPMRVPAVHTASVAQEIISLTRSADSGIRMCAYQSLTQWSQWSPAVASIGISAFTNLDEQLWNPASSLLVQLVADHLVSDDQLSDACASLIDRLSEQKPNRDLPALQRLTMLTSLLTAQPWTQRTKFQTALQALAELFGRSELLASLAVDLRAGAVDWSQPFAVAPFIESSPGSLLLTHRAGVALSATLAEQLATGTWHQPSAYASCQSALGASDVATRYVATQLIICAGTQLGWPQPWPDLLTTARADSHPDIKHQTHSTFLATE